jgi:NAD(P)-dependent dehydrogenase (short-subunit alcohol dehydrogenase family)
MSVAAMPVPRSAALVTGSTDGIGFTTAKHLAALGFDVLIHGRDSRRIEQARQEIESFAASARRSKTSREDSAASNERPASRIWPLPACDLSTTAGATQLGREVKKLCDQEKLNLPIVMNNAGVFAEDHVITSEGLELTFAVNVVAPFIVTSLLLPLLLRQKSRIVIASSISQSSSIRDWKDMSYNRRPYSAHAAYSESKLLDAVLTMEMASRFQQASIGTDRITCNCLDPGTVNTKMLLSGWGPCGIDVEDALDETWLCTSEEVGTVTGKYFVHRSDRRAAQAAYEKGVRDDLWSLLCELSPEAASMWNLELATSRMNEP